MKPGDRVKIETSEDSFEGVLLPRPEILEEGILVLKLDNGYNIGIEEGKITNRELISEKSVEDEVVGDIELNPDLPNVAILSMGGTISSKIDYTTGGVNADYDAKDFLAMCPELGGVANIEAKKVMGIMSEDVDLKTISEIGKSLIEYVERDDIKGIVVTMGTDCLHYVSSALSFMLKGVNKPIVITASQRSIDRGSSDAFMNLSCAVKVAASFDVKGVVSCMHGTSSDDYCLVVPGAKVRKMHTSRRDAFRPINTQELCRVNYPSLDIEEISKLDEVGDFETKLNLSSKVGLLYVHPGINPGVIDYYIDNGYDGLVIAGTALGHVPTEGDSNLLPVLEKAISAGMVVGIVTQTLYGRTHQYVYANLRKLSISLGCSFGEDMLMEAAYMKMCWLLGNYSKEEAKGMFGVNLVGEISSRIDGKSYLN